MLSSVQLRSPQRNCSSPLSGAFVIAVVKDGVLAARLLHLRVKRDDKVRHAELADVSDLRDWCTVNHCHK